jgi:2,3-bisphosphoglycerate-independent phosphoglycerate mutase
MRCILVILDGLGDRGVAAFGGKTPLQQARTPNLDRLAALGMNGLMHPWFQGVALPSEIAHFLLFGYEIKDFPGRGYIEALGENIPVGPGEIALLARIFAVREDQGHLVLEVEDPKLEPEICLTLQAEIRHFRHEGLEVEFIPTKGIGGIVLVKGEEVAPEITDSNPIYEGRPLMEVMPYAAHGDDLKARKTAAALNHYLTWCYQRLGRHPINNRRRKAKLPPINAVGTQRPGCQQPIQPFPEKWGLRSLAIASGALYRGLSLHLGMAQHPVKDTDRPGEDLRERLQLARAATEFDFIYVHTKAPDEAAHTKKPERKRAVLEELDKAFAVALEDAEANSDTLWVITADHSTNSSGRMIHSGESVPLCMVGRYPRRDAVQRFDEVSCAGGALGTVRGQELMYLILNFLDRGKLFSLMDSPWDQPFFPGKYKPLAIK